MPVGTSFCRWSFQSHPMRNVLYQGSKVASCARDLMDEDVRASGVSAPSLAGPAAALSLAALF